MRAAPSRTSTRRPRSSTRSTTARRSSTSASAARRPPRSRSARSTTRSRRECSSSRPSATATTAGTRSSIRPRSSSRSARTASAAAASRSPRRRARADARRSRRTGTHVSLAAPGVGVFSAVSSGLAGVALSAHDAAGRARRGLRLRQRHLVRVAAGRGCGRARVGREPAAPRCPGRVDPRADGVRAGQLERRARLRRPRRRCGGGEGTVDARGAVGPRCGRASPRSHAG